MAYFLAALPLVILLALMLAFRWSGPKAGLAGWLAAVAAGALGFGLTPQVFWVSQVKGLLISLYSLAIFWPALYLYNLVRLTGGIRAMAAGLERAVGDRGVLEIVLAFAFSAFLEGMVGFGVPIAVVAPILVGLGVEPLTAVAAVAIGHTWSVTFGDVGMIYQTLLGVVQMQPGELIPASGLMLGVAAVACGLAAAWVLKQLRHWPVVLALGALMGAVQYLLAMNGLPQLAAFGAGLAGLAGAGVYGVLRRGRAGGETAPRQTGSHAATPGGKRAFHPAMASAFASYGLLTALLVSLALPTGLRAGLYPLAWQLSFPQVMTRSGFVTPAGMGQIFRFFLHPGTAILAVGALCTWVFSHPWFEQKGIWSPAFAATRQAAVPASLGILAMVGVSTLMDHTGMTLLLAQGLSRVMGRAFPLISPWIGILGAFCSGSNNNSNVLFGMLQKNAALLLKISPAVLVAAQTTGGALGGMVAPAKLVLGCSNVGRPGTEGAVLKKTLPFGLAVGLLVGILALLLVR